MRSTFGDEGPQGMGPMGVLDQIGDDLGQARALADQLPQLVWSCRPDGWCDFLNRRWVEYTGVEESQHHGSGWLDVVHPEDRAGALELWRRFLLGETEYELEYRLRRRDGVYRWFKTTGLTTRDSIGNPRRIFGTTIDVDDQKRNEADLRESRERLTAALEASGTGTFRWEMATDSLDWDAQLDRLFGLAPGETVLSFEQFLARVHPEDRPGVLERCALCRNEGADFAMEYRVIWPDGSVRWLDDRGRTSLGPDGRPATMTGACVDITERKAAEAQIRQGDQRVRETLESVTDAFCALDVDWRFTYLNTQAERLLERQAGDLIGKVLWDEYPGLAGSEFERLYRNVARDRVTGSIRAFYPDHDRWYEVHAYPAVRGGVTLSFRDKSEMIRSQTEIARLAEGRRLALDAAGLGSWHIDAASGELKTDERLREIFGVADESFGYEDAIARIHPDDRERVRASVAATSNPRDARPYADEHRVIWPDGTVRWVSAIGRASFQGEGEARRLTRLDGIVADITDRKKTEAALREGEQRLKAAHDLLEGITESTRELIAALDPEYRFTFVNAAYRSDFRRVFGTEARVGASMIELLAHLPEDQANATALWGRALAGEDLSVTMEFGDPGLERRVFDLRFSPIRDASGKIVGAGEIARDVTERVREEEARRDADRRKDEFLALLAHELRNPLAPLRNGLEILRLAGLNDPEMAGKAREMMERQLSHMVRLVDDLLDISRVSRGKMELRKARVTLAEVIAAAVETARPSVDAGGHQLQIDLPNQLLELDADLTRLAQVFSNLLTNAARYTDPGGRLKIQARRDGDQVEVSVIDTGMGIPADALPTIFDMFSQVEQPSGRSTGGLGIGLALVKGLVEMHGGRVSASSQGAGHGSTFVVRLPLLAGKSVARAILKQEGMSVTPARRILVVDDNWDSALSMASMLELLGHTVAIAHDGLDAIDAADRLLPELILMDVGMPRLGGYEATSKIRERSWSRSTTIVAITGWGQEADRVKSRAAGCDGHLVKPVHLAELDPYLAIAGQREGTSGA